MTGCVSLDDPSAEAVDERDETFLVDGKLDEVGGASEAEQAALIRLVSSASFETLDDDVALDRRAAENIVAHRLGPDGVSGTADDDRIDTLAELDAVPWIGPSAFKKLLAYVRALGLADSGSTCLIISEYIEGSGARNKFMELYNCGRGPVQLGEYGVCIVRNDDTTCSRSTPLEDAELDAGEVVTVCRSLSGSISSPWPPFRDACQQPLGSVMTFSGDDRMVVYRDLNDDGRFEIEVDGVMDVLGRFGWRPGRELWSNLGLRRCNLTPNKGDRFYRHTDYFTEHGWSDYSDFGLPPDRDCVGLLFE